LEKTQGNIAFSKRKREMSKKERYICKLMFSFVEKFLAMMFIFRSFRQFLV